MNKKILVSSIVAAAAGIALIAYLNRPQPALAPVQAMAPAEATATVPAVSSFIDPSDRALVARGQAIYANNCASCHGVKLEGQPDWRQRLPNGRLPAPPHDVSGHTWHHPDQVLVDIVTHGLVPGKTAPEGYQSDMPAYTGTLKDADIVAVLAYIKSSWPADALEAQRNITLQNK